MAGKERCTLEFEKKDLIKNKRENIEEAEWTEKEET